MIKQKQLNRHNPESGVFGDCCRTVLACLLNKAPTEVPNFAEKNWGNADDFNSAKEDWLAQEGWREITIALPGEENDLEDALEVAASWSKDAFYMLHGTSRNKVNHVVIAHKNKIYWDTAIDDSGIVGPLDVGQWQFSFLVPMALSEQD